MVGLSAIAKRKLERTRSAEATTSSIQDDVDAEDIAINAFFVDSAIVEEQQDIESRSDTPRKTRKKSKATSSTTKLGDKSGSDSTEDVTQRRKRKQKAQHYDYNCVSNFGTSESTTLFDSESIYLGFDNHASLILAGKFRLQVLKGSLDIFGTTINASEVVHSVYAPTCYPLPTLSAGTDNPTTLEGVPPALAHNNAVVRLSELKDGLETLGNALPDFKNTFEAPYEGSYEGWNAVKGLYPILESTSNVYAYLLPPSWTSAANIARENSFRSAEPYIAIVKGWKNTGKSAFSRLLSNTLKNSHKKVAYLECDIGQSEFMPSGCVSLHLLDEYLLGPAFTHPRIPAKAHFIGDVSPVNDPSNYVDAIKDLIEHYHSHIAHSLSEDGDYTPIPLVINTQGWIKGLGAELLEGILAAAGTYNLVEMSAFVEQPSEEDNERKDDESTIKIDAIATAENPMLNRYHSADYRNLMMSTYFHSKIQENNLSWDFSLPLTHMVPLCVDYCDDLSYVSIIDGEDVALKHTLMALNATVVALVEGGENVDNNGELLRRDDLTTFKQSRVLGYGLIRAIDSNANQLQILTPLDVTLCRRVNVLMKGKVDLPVCSLIDWTDRDIDYANVPYITNEVAVGEGAQKRKVRKDIQRKAANN
ncbi:hypothetical protein E3Q22_00603 [Wallemia mellicola]|uniref:Polynucleotide 5'-hydroxyl-kinase GRC3 n=2 Tax=Wallemia mellicola TaxID=1708541 RepID=A0A4T0TQ12_9BASI|nr:hypothetical protein WALSEDRAFT_43922 [Wallemia mellicola CBS 633.66]TIB72269.1 hypothetical protein E3Q24_01773 [Wallemia mellicola]EIM23010.1 hypothetical protein WALSEDRAFT_43922 [Wallemia mellicola CBS 633.66]TIB81924.1 hypothetical protein E3Q22_00603 [Wallemia mellicola]TIC18033.1 hypothetical protein E3Q15_00370 [Wallemia mellicola]TIC18655.1 hypothetical protein E3Q13_01869 [Wallemia mellicola]|eukprot:XP_006957049.1 hypothetical protein WALSEDRAFT_43922 [Wallemia mellicola CBS 633.66]